MLKQLFFAASLVLGAAAARADISDDLKGTFGYEQCIPTGGGDVWKSIWYYEAYDGSSVTTTSWMFHNVDCSGMAISIFSTSPYQLTTMPADGGYYPVDFGPSTTTYTVARGISYDVWCDGEWHSVAGTFTCRKGPHFTMVNVINDRLQVATCMGTQRNGSSPEQRCNGTGGDPRWGLLRVPSSKQ